MSFKGKVQANPIAQHSYQFLVVGMPPLVVTKVGSLEDEIETITLPDRTRHPGGEKPPTEIVITVPSHHTVEQLALELWWEECQHPISPNAKKTGTLVRYRGDGSIGRKFLCTGAFPMKHARGEGDMENADGYVAEDWTLSIDDVKALP